MIDCLLCVNLAFHCLSIEYINPAMCCMFTRVPDEDPVWVENICTKEDQV